MVGSKGSSVVMFDNGGTVEILDCRFEDNSNENDSSNQQGGSGLHIVLSYCSPRPLSDPTDKCFDVQISYSSYLIQGCIFTNHIDGPGYNDTSCGHFPEDTELLAEGFSRGGGLSVVLDRNSTANSLHIIGCNFTGNSAVWGGLHSHGRKLSQQHCIHVENSVFLNNHCTHLSGGGVVLAVPGKRFELPIATQDDFNDVIQGYLCINYSRLSNHCRQIHQVFWKAWWWGGCCAREYTKGKLCSNFGLGSCSVHQDLYSWSCNDSKCVWNFSGIQSCNEEDFQAHLYSRYWVGYDLTDFNDSTLGREDEFLYATCPSGRCLSKEQKNNFMHNPHSCACATYPQTQWLQTLMWEY